MSNQAVKRSKGGRRTSTRIAQKPPPSPPLDHSSDSSDEDIPSPPDDSDEEDVYDDAADVSDEDEDVDEGVADELDLGREPTKSSGRKSTAAHAAAGTRSWIQRRRDEKARRFPEFRGAAWLLAHPPRKAFKKDNTMERSWMNRRMPFAFKNNNTRLRTSCGIELFTKRPMRDAPASDPKGKKKAASKKYGDWSKPEHGANELNMPQDFLKFLWDDGMPGESVKEPMAIEDRQVVRCDENFGVHPHANNAHHPDGFTCCETPKSHLDIYIKERREEIEWEQQQEDEKAQAAEELEGSDDDSEAESSSKKNTKKPSKSRRSSARWSAKKAKLTDKLLLSEVYNWEDHEFVICTECDDQQLHRLANKAKDGHFHGAMVPLCEECSVTAVNEYGFGYNGCECDQQRRCLNHRIEHLEQLTDAREDYVKKNQPRGGHPALAMYNKLFKKADKKEQQGDGDFEYPEITPLCPNCRKNFPPPVPTHFAYNCRRCDEELVMPAPEDRDETWQDICEAPQSFVKNLGRPLERSLAMLGQKWNWNAEWVGIYKQYAANPLPEEVESAPGNVADDKDVDNYADDYAGADAGADADSEHDSDATRIRGSLYPDEEDGVGDQVMAGGDDQGLTAEEEYHLNVAGAMHPAHPTAGTPAPQDTAAMTNTNADQSAPASPDGPPTTPPLAATPMTKRKRDDDDGDEYWSPGALVKRYRNYVDDGEHAAAAPVPVGRSNESVFSDGGNSMWGGSQDDEGEAKDGDDDGADTVIREGEDAQAGEEQL